MVQKRPFGVEELYEVSSKHPRQLEHKNRLVSVLEFPSEDVTQKPHASGEGEDGFTKSKAECDEQLASGNIAEYATHTEKDIETSLPGCISNSSWASSSTSEDDFKSEAPFHLLFTPEFYNPYRPVRTLVHSEDVYSSLLEYPHRKLVSIGPDFQADIPEWGAQGAKNTSNCSDSAEALTLSSQTSESELVDHINDENRLAGTCVIPMPEAEPCAYIGDKFGDGRTDCYCEDAGSVRCVRQHIMEAREKLRRTVGQETFVELGFCDMGEVVSEKWSEEEEQLFHKVVFSNPASLGKNFWDHLAIVFPFRTKRDIISYYFNVFMLRRRSEQNRYDPVNIDSDNDEWQGVDDSGEDEVGMIEEDEDSVVESPVYQDDPGRNEIHEYDSHEYDEGVAHANCDDCDFGSNKDISNASETRPRKLLNHCSSEPTLQPPDKIFWDKSGDHAVQDDSCTSSDTGAAPQVTPAKVDNSKHWPGTFNGMSGHEFVLEPCDAKVWDVGYLGCPKSEVDFLPTCSMIEEVFGVGAWNYKARDGKGLS